MLKDREEIVKEDYMFDNSPESNPIKEKSGILSFWCDLEYSKPLIEKLNIKDILKNNNLKENEYEIYFDINVLKPGVNIRIESLASYKTVAEIELSKEEYKGIRDYAEGYIQWEWADFNPIERPLTLIEFYATKVLYDENFECDPNVDCEECFILAEGINKIKDFYNNESTQNEKIDIHEIMDVYIDRLKKGIILDKDRFRELDDINLIRSFEALQFQIEGEKYREEHQGRNNFLNNIPEEDSEEEL